jgi:hypothetical protein
MTRSSSTAGSGAVGFPLALIGGFPECCVESLGGHVRLQRFCLQQGRVDSRQRVAVVVVA